MGASCAWGREATGSPACLWATVIGFREAESPLGEPVGMERRAHLALALPSPSLMSPQTPPMSGPGFPQGQFLRDRGPWGQRPGHTASLQACSLCRAQPQPMAGWSYAQHHGQLPYPFWGSLGWQGSPAPPFAPPPGWAVSLPAGHRAQPLAAGTQAPIDSWSCFLRHHVGGGRERGARGSAGA